MTTETLDVFRLVMSVAPLVVVLYLLQRLSARLTYSLRRMERQLDEQHALIVKCLGGTWADPQRELVERDRRADARAEPREPVAVPIAIARLVTR